MDLKIRKNKKSYTLADMYKAYTKENEIDIDYERFKTVLDKFNDEVKTAILERSEGFKMPFGLGYIRIVKYKPKRLDRKSLSIDYKSSREIGKTIFHLNEHSGGYKYRLYWSKIPQTFPDRYRYQLCLVRQNKRYLAQLIFKHNDYINADDIQIYQM